MAKSKKTEREERGSEAEGAASLRAEPAAGTPPRAPHGIGRQLVVFCDGTNNTLTGQVRDTNVLKLYEHLARHGGEGQILYYDPGVGSPDAMPGLDLIEHARRWWERIRGLAFGNGVFENVGEAYAFLCREYRPGDEIFIFGFSRGAFTARSIAGMVHLFGIVQPQHVGLLSTLVRVYFAPRDGKVPGGAKSPTHEAAKQAVEPKPSRRLRRTRGDIAEQVRLCFTTPEGREARVRFVGVWDTVASVGVWPFNLQITSKATISAQGGEPAKRIDHVRHALSLDEQRAPFAPRLYSQDNFGDESTPQSLKQEWFHGVHCDAGGGYAVYESGLSNEALEWMHKEAHRCGLRPHDCSHSLHFGGERLAHDVPHENSLWALTGLTARDTTRAAGTGPRDSVPVHPVAAEQAPPKATVWRQRRNPAWILALLIAVVGLFACAGSLTGKNPLHTPLFEWPALFAEGVSNPSVSPLQFQGLCHPVATWTAAHGADASPLRRSIRWDFVLVVGYAWLCARLVAWAFVRMVGPRKAGDGPLARARLGLALPLLVVADVVENLLTLVVCATSCGWLGPAAAFLVGVVCLAKFAGLLGVLVLIGWGALFPAKP